MEIPWFSNGLQWKCPGFTFSLSRLPPIVSVPAYTSTPLHNLLKFTCFSINRIKREKCSIYLKNCFNMNAYVIYRLPKTITCWLQFMAYFWHTGFCSGQTTSELLYMWSFQVSNFVMSFLSHPLMSFLCDPFLQIFAVKSGIWKELVLGSRTWTSYLAFKILCVPCTHLA